MRMANIFGSVAAAVIASIVSVAQTSSAEDRSRTGQVKAENSPSTGNTYRVQFGAFSSEKDAEHGWKAVEASAKNLLGDLSHEVVSAGFCQEKDVVYRLRAGSRDMQGPHEEDEVYFVLSGRARIRVGEEVREVRPGSLLYVRASTDHAFFEIEEDITLLVLFTTS